jgi:hypothetical protein
MTIDDKINNIRQYIEKYATSSDKKILESVLDILEDLNNELNELSESIHF